LKVQQITLGLTISIDEGFRERKLADSFVVNFDKVILKYWENFDFSLSGGETGYFAQDRGVIIFSELVFGR